MDAAYTAAYAELYRRHWWWRSRERMLLGRIAEILGGRAGHARVLDVGCGAGLFFEALAPFGRVEGVESDPVAVAQSGSRKPQIHLGDLDSLPTTQPFDLVMFLDVLEHLSRPEMALRRAATLLKADGTILITVPAFQWLWTSHDELNHHVRRFSAGELADLVHQSGLDVVRMQYLFPSLVLPKLLSRVHEALFGRNASVPQVPASALNVRLQEWFRLEHALFSWLPIGTSVMAEVRPPR